MRAHWLEMRVYPPLVMLICAAPAASGQFAASPALNWLAALLLVLSGAFGLSVVWHFHRAGTTNHPFRPGDTRSLVTGGVYRWSRNPMYLALVLMLAAIYLVQGCIWGLVAVPVFMLWMHHVQIVAEERLLEAHFGEAYRRYKQRVRRWC